jgi:hypothetical protein
VVNVRDDGDIAKTLAQNCFSFFLLGETADNPAEGLGTGTISLQYAAWKNFTTEPRRNRSAKRDVAVEEWNAFAQVRDAGSSHISYFVCGADREPETRFGL